ncbi:MAG: hypothetical protein LBG96_10310, partial [Tannerella sp.]|nr:hypothetical protein [Tannerella sp.]
MKVSPHSARLILTDFNFRTPDLTQIGLSRFSTFIYSAFETDFLSEKMMLKPDFFGKGYSYGC